MLVSNLNQAGTRRPPDVKYSQNLMMFRLARMAQEMTASDDQLITDEKLADVVKQRDQSAEAMRQATDGFSKLYERHSRLLLAFLSSRVNRSDLEDVHQTVWQKIWQYLPGQFKGGNFRAWMHQIARNHLIDLSRKRRPDEMGEGPEIIDSSEGVEAPLEHEERQEILANCLRSLQQQMADIVRGRLAGENYEQICERLDVNAARAHKLFFQAKEQLSNCVQKAMQ